MKARTTPIIIYIDRGQMSFYVRGVAQIPTVDLSQAVVDLEIKNAEQVAQGIKAVLDGLKITAGAGKVGFSPNVVFEKDFAEGGEEVHEKEIEDFLKMVPFGRMRHRVYRVGKGCKVVVVNRDFYESMGEILSKMGVGGVAMLPASVVPVAGLQNGLTGSIGRDLLNKLGILSQLHFDYAEMAAKNAAAENSPDPRINKHLLVLLGVFGALLVILGIVAVMAGILPGQQNKRSPAKAPAVVAPPPPAPIASKSANEPVKEASAGAEVDLAATTIEVLNATGASGQAQNVKETLTAAGFKNVQIGNAPTIQAAKVQVVFSPKVSSGVREKLLTALTPSFGELATRESASQSFDVVVTLTKPVSSTSGLSGQ